MSLRQIVSQPWSNVQVFAESIPHLLHWDLAYLWVLEKPEQLRPAEWRLRLEAWKRLVGWLLLGELEMERYPLQPPLDGHTKKFKVESAEALRFKSDPDRKPVATLSPTVLVRPLPDANPEELLRTIPPIPATRRADHDYFFSLAVNALRESTSQIANGLADILQREVAVIQPRAGAYDNVILDARILTRLDDRSWQEPEYSTVQLLVYRPGRELWVPRCSRCSTALTHAEGEWRQPEGSTVRLRCSQNPEHFEDIHLEQLLIWGVSEESVRVWMNRDLPFAAANPALPPRADIQGQDVVFHWPANLTGDLQRVWLRLRFPQARLQAVDFIGDVLFRRLLVPGSRQGCTGFPFRAKWWSAIRHLPSIQHRETGIRFSGIGLHGVPFLFDYIYGTQVIQEEPALQIGIFPRRMSEQWKRYRVFLSGSRAPDHRVVEPRPMDGLPSVAETNRGWPTILSVEAPDGTTGATWATGQDFPPPPPLDARPNVYMGLDFGTTHSLLCFTTDQDRTAHTWLSLKDISDAAQRVAGGEVDAAFFLPHSEHHETLIPSTLWRLDEANRPAFIRWNEAGPSQAYRAAHGFKWDPAAPGQFDWEREAYLRELLFLALPGVLKKLDLIRSAPNINLGVAYPLALPSNGVEHFRNVLGKASDSLRTDTGASLDILSVNESVACVRAFGAVNPGETFLIADMGGGTLDVALFVSSSGDQEPDYHQVGSVRFGGETFVVSLASKKAGGGNAEAQYWRIRSAIVHGRMMNEFPNDPDVESLLKRMLPLGLEFLRTMIAAHLAEFPGQRIQVVLAGNGWRLCEFLYGGQQSAEQALRNYFGSKIETFEFEHVELYQGRLALPSSKHMVSSGALNNASGGLRLRALDGDPKPSCLPAGRKISFSTRDTNQTVFELDWKALVGLGANVRLPQPGNQLRLLRTDFDFQAGPPVPQGWENWLKQALPQNPYPEPDQLRKLFLDEIKDDWIDRGPLQLIIEHYWAKSI